MNNMLARVILVVFIFIATFLLLSMAEISLWDAKVRMIVLFTTLGSVFFFFSRHITGNKLFWKISGVALWIISLILFISMKT